MKSQRIRGISILAFVLAAGCGVAIGAASPPASTAADRVRIADTGPVEPLAESCGNDPVAAQLAELIRQHPLQQRVQLRCSGLHAEVAAQKAAEMARLGQVSHTYGVVAPIPRLGKAGYALPSNYPGTNNNYVESISGAIAIGQKV